MTNRMPIPEPVHWIIIWLNTTVSTEDIAMYTDVSVHKVKAILLYFKQHGTVNVPKHLQWQIQCKISDDDIEVSTLL